MNYEITHRTSYRYTDPVSVSHHVARLRPRTTRTQKLGQFELRISPQPAVRKDHMDYFGNEMCMFSIQHLHKRLEVVMKSFVTVNRPQPTSFPESPAWEQVAELFCDPVSPQRVEPYQFIFDSPQIRTSPQQAEYAQECFPAGTPILVGTAELTGRIFTDFKYLPKATTVATPLEEAWEKRHGVCQDFAHIAIACLRSLGLPACYVSGYLRTRPPEGQPPRIGADASHAWFAVYCPGTGWVEFDPTNNLQPADEHITVAFGRDFGDVSPVAGILTGGGEHKVKVGVDVVAVEA